MVQEYTTKNKSRANFQLHQNQQNWLLFTKQGILFTVEEEFKKGFLSISLCPWKINEKKISLKITLPNLFSKSKWFVKFCHRYRAVLWLFYQSTFIHEESET